MPVVTVIIPNYNHARYLPQRIESVLNQTFRDIEIILLDDCSPDVSRTIIAKYAALDSRIQVVLNEKNSGSTFKQWNKGFNLAKGKYIWIAESDDYADAQLLETLIERLEADPNIGLAYCGSNTVDENNAEINALGDFYSELDPVLWTRDFVVDGRELINKFMSFRNIIPNASAVVMRKSVIDKVGIADENYKINGDWVFWAAIIANVKVAFMAEKLNYFRYHLNNVRSKTKAKGIALREWTNVMIFMQRYGKPNPRFLDAAIATITKAWFEEIINIPIKTSLAIYKNLKKVDEKFYLNLKNVFLHNIINHKFNKFKRLIRGSFLF